jgi:hypothetical protein
MGTDDGRKARRTTKKSSRSKDFGPPDTDLEDADLEEQKSQKSGGSNNGSCKSGDDESQGNSIFKQLDLSSKRKRSRTAPPDSKSSNMKYTYMVLAVLAIWVLWYAGSIFSRNDSNEVERMDSTTKIKESSSASTQAKKVDDAEGTEGDSKKREKDFDETNETNALPKSKQEEPASLWDGLLEATPEPPDEGNSFKKDDELTLDSDPDSTSVTSSKIKDVSATILTEPTIESDKTDDPISKADDNTGKGAREDDQGAKLMSDGKDKDGSTVLNKLVDDKMMPKYEDGDNTSQGKGATTKENGTIDDHADVMMIQDDSKMEPQDNDGKIKNQRESNTQVGSSRDSKVAIAQNDDRDQQHIRKVDKSVGQIGESMEQGSDNSGQMRSPDDGLLEQQRGVSNGKVTNQGGQEVMMTEQGDADENTMDKDGQKVAFERGSDSGPSRMRSHDGDFQQNGENGGDVMDQSDQQRIKKMNQGPDSISNEVISHGGDMQLLSPRPTRPQFPLRLPRPTRPQVPLRLPRPTQTPRPTAKPTANPTPGPTANL